MTYVSAAIAVRTAEEEQACRYWTARSRESTMSTGQYSAVDEPTQPVTTDPDEVAHHHRTTGSGVMTSSSSRGAGVYFQCAVLVVAVSSGHWIQRGRRSAEECCCSPCFVVVEHVATDLATLMTTMMYSNAV